MFCDCLHISASFNSSQGQGWNIVALAFTKLADILSFAPHIFIKQKSLDYRYYMYNLSLPIVLSFIPGDITIVSLVIDGESNRLGLGYNLSLARHFLKVENRTLLAP